MAAIQFVPYLLHSKSTNVPYETRAPSTSLVSPLLWCDQPEGSFNTAIIPFQNQIEDRINERKQAGAVAEISYYFRDMNSGYWIALNEEDVFKPASLFKLPIYMTLKKQAELNPTFWKSRLKFSNLPEIPAQYYPPNIPLLVDGQEYGIGDLVERMIVHSDNQALYTLVPVVDPTASAELQKLIGVNAPSQDIDFITVRQYASLFRLLYNASFLSKEGSEEVLKMLSRVQFDLGIRAPVPSSITISHKFGERQIIDTGLTQLHDCGIVYYPNHPYMICVMTKGKNFKDLQSVIADLSKITYENVLKSTQRTR